MIRIFGYGGFAREVAVALKRETEAFYTEIGFIVEDAFFTGQPDCIPVSKYEEEAVILAVGDPTLRYEIFQRNAHLSFIDCNNGLMFSGRIGTGCIIQPGSILTVNVKLGIFVIVNLNCTVGHDSEIGNFTTLAPGVNVSGNVKIGEFCYIGSNAVIREKITICDNVTIGAGAVVVKDITEPGTYVGNPSKLIKK